ncbi:MAG: carbon-nitrogen family hydrolase [Thermodesulfobacteriota bacterium]
MKNKMIRAGVVQFDTRLGDTETNIRSALAGIQELADLKADIAVLPELWPAGFDNANMAFQAARAPHIVEVMTSWALEHRMVIAGSIAEADGSRIYNTLVVIDKDGRVAGRYRKIHLFSPSGENRYFAGGDARVVCETAAGRLGLMICYDLRFPELCRALALNDAQCVIVPAQWPTPRIDQWEILLKARALENQLFVLGANRCGQDPGMAYGGGSRIVSPRGETLALAPADGPRVLCADLDRSVMEDFRNQIPCFRDRVPQSYGTPKGES